MSTVNLNVNPGTTSTLKFLTKETYNPEDIEFQISSTGGTKPQEFCTCSTGATTNQKSISCSDAQLVAGALYAIKFTNELKTSTGTTNITLKIGDLAAKNLFWRGKACTTTNYQTGTVIANSGAIVTVMYDGTQYQIVAIDEQITTTIRTWSE